MIGTAKSFWPKEHPLSPIPDCSLGEQVKHSPVLLWHLSYLSYSFVKSHLGSGFVKDLPPLFSRHTVNLLGECASSEIFPDSFILILACFPTLPQPSLFSSCWSRVGNFCLPHIYFLPFGLLKATGEDGCTAMLLKEAGSSFFRLIFILGTSRGNLMTKCIKLGENAILLFRYISFPAKPNA